MTHEEERYRQIVRQVGERQVEEWDAHVRRQCWPDCPYCAYEEAQAREDGTATYPEDEE